MKKFEYPVAVFLIIMGVSIIGVWTLLMVTGQMPAFSTLQEHIAVSMHLTSEMLLAVLSLLTGAYLFFGSIKAAKGTFFVLGLATGSTFFAVIHYAVIEPELLLVVLTGIFLVLSVTAFIAGLFLENLQAGRKQVLYKSGLFLFGLLEYYLMNTAASYATSGSWHFFGQSILFIIIIGTYIGALVSHSHHISLDIDNGQLR